MVRAPWTAAPPCYRLARRLLLALRRWSDPAYVHQNAERLALSPRRAAWYPKPAATFADALARLRQHLWFEHLVTSVGESDMTEPIPPGLRRLVEVACYAP